MALKKCKECGKEISTEAKECPQCGKPQPKKTNWGCILPAILIPFGFIVWVATTMPPTTQRTPPIVSLDPKTATDSEIYQEFEFCMDSAKKKLSKDELEGTTASLACMTQLKKYGDQRAGKAFGIYFDLKPGKK